MVLNNFIQLLSILLWILWFIQNFSFVQSDQTFNNETNMINNETYSSCSRILTYDEVKAILAKHSCLPIEDESTSTNRRRVKRWGGNDNKVNALSSTINEHQTIINYLMNTSINATFMKDAIQGSILDHHERSGPSFRSWRDLFDLLCMMFIFCSVTYVLVFRCGFAPCNRCLITLSKYMTPRTQQKKQQELELQEQIKKQFELIQQQQQLQKEKEKQTKTKTHSIRRKKPNFPSTPSVLSDVVQTNNAYVSE